MLEKFYRGKRVLVTGGAGFVGTWLVRRLLEFDLKKLSVMDNYSRGTGSVSGVNYYRRGDVTDIENCYDAFSDHDVIFNLAATVAGVLHNMSHHHEMFMGNVAVQTVPLAVAGEVGVEHFLQVSTVCVYAPEFIDPASESNGLEGVPHKANWGYAWAKRMGERLVEVSTVPHTVIVRPSNIFGPGDYFDERAHVIPALIKRAYEPGVMEVFGDPNIKREFIYVKDVVEGMIYAMAAGKNKEAYNLGTDGRTQVTLTNLVGLILELTGNLNKEVTFNVGKGGGDKTRSSDGIKMRDVTGWTHKTTLREGLEETIKSYETSRHNQ